MMSVDSPYPTAAERLRLPVASMREVLLAATTVAPRRRKSATSWARHLRMRAATAWCRMGEASAEAGLHSQRQRFFSSSSAYLHPRAGLSDSHIYSRNCDL